MESKYYKKCGQLVDFQSKVVIPEHLTQSVRQPIEMAYSMSSVFASLGMKLAQM